MINKKIYYCIIFMCCIYGDICNAKEMMTDRTQKNAIQDVIEAKRYINQHGIQGAISYYNTTHIPIFIGDYRGYYFVSPLHPELIGHNELNYKDPFGVYAVKQEVDLAKSGGGWLKGRIRLDKITGTYQCRKIYVSPINETYYIGSWYHYPLDKQGRCLV